MAAKSTAAAVAEPTPSWDNPLIPNKKLRQLYAAMVELRLLEEHLARTKRRKSSPRSHRGEEACFVSTVFSLLPGDLTSESSNGIAIQFLRGIKLVELLHRDSSMAKSASREQLPQLKDTAFRLHVAVGAALALASGKKSSLAVAYVHTGDLAFQQWKPVLKFAASHGAPILFVVLCHSEEAVKPGQLSLAATACGVPGIPVDASDPIALYRVAQEAMLRVRGGGGPVLMECVPFQLPGKAAGHADPIHRMQQLLSPRKIATEAWFEEVAIGFATRLKAACK